MSGFLAEIGKKLAERWATLLALPGLLYLAVALSAHTLGWAHPFDVELLSRSIARWAATPAFQSVGGTVLIVAAALLGSAGIGLTAAGLGVLVSYLWNLPGRLPPARWLAGSRRRRSARAKKRADDPRSTPAQVRAAIAAADRLCLVEADRPTWVGDRLRATRVRVETAYGLDLDAVWPRLWLLFGDTTRAEILAAREAYTGAARLMGWAALYLLPAGWWWPSLLIGLGVGVAAWVRARSAAGQLADLLEATVDLHARELATRMGHPDTAAPLSAAEGQALSALIRKSRWDPDSPLAA